MIRKLVVLKMVLFYAVIGTLVFISCSDEVDPEPKLTQVDLFFSLNDAGDGYILYSARYDTVTAIIPETYNGLPVTGICERTFGFYYTDLVSVTIPASVTEIGFAAFSGCTSLESVIFAEGSKLQIIEEHVFSGCASLTSITIPASVTSIYSSAFSECTSLTSITFETGSRLQTIEEYVFGGCTSLTSITIPANVTSIHNSAFFGTSLAAINVSNDNPNYASENGILYNKAKTEFITVPQGIYGSITIPASVTSISNSAFSWCTSLTSITIPSSVTSIGEYAFYGCTSLTSITIPASVTSIQNSAFSGCTSLTAINVNSSNPYYASEDGILYDKAKTTLERVPQGIYGSVTIPASVTSIGRYAFYGCTFTSITIPEGVTYIGEDAFSRCTSLTSIIIPSSVMSIGRYAFSSCTSLTSITISEGVTSIGESAFSGCTSLTSITIPSSVTSIGRSAFSGCTNLTSITISEGVTSIDESAFSRCTSLTSITIPSSVTYIGSGAFSYWTTAQTIYLEAYSHSGGPDAAWGADWRNGCNAVIKYWNGSGWI